MSETQFPPPRGTPLSNATPSGAERLLIRDAQVTQAPPSLSQPDKTLLLDGRVTGQDRTRGEIKISTGSGDIVVKSTTPLPIGTDVTVELKMQQLSLRANIAVLRQKNTEARATAEIIKPPPTTAAAAPTGTIPKSGDSFPVLRLPPDAPAAAPTSATSTTTPPALPPTSVPTLEEAARIIEALRALGITRMPSMLPSLPPIPLPVLWQVLNTRDVMSALVRLPETMQTQIQQFLAQPDVRAAIKQVLPPQQFSTLFPTTTPPDDVLQQVQTATAPRNAPMPQNALQGLMPLIQALLPGIGAEAATLAAGRIPTAPVTTTALPLPQNMMQMTVHGIVPADGTDTPDFRPTGSLVADVESVTPSGFTVLKTPDGHFVTQQPLALPMGTRLIVTVTQMTAAEILAGLPSNITGSTAASPFDPLSSRNWPALSEALQLLGTTAAQTAALLQNTIPTTAAARLAPTALFFLAALRIGSIESWLGENILQALRQTGRKDLVDKLTQDFGRIASQSKTAVAGEWRVISMPLLQDSHLSQIQFFVRQQHPDAEDGDAQNMGERAKMTRFILNLSLSRMGDMQLDGLLHQKHLNLILRSDDKLPPDIRQQVQQRFTAGVEQTGMEGSISFQTRAEKWVTIETDPRGQVV